MNRQFQGLVATSACLVGACAPTNDVGRVVVGPSPASATTTAPAPLQGPALDAGAPLTPSPFPDSPRPSLGGTVYDEVGRPVPGVRISLESPEMYGPNEESTTTDVDGTWVLNKGTRDDALFVFASKPGWTTRLQVRELPQPWTKGRIQVDFGGDDPDGAPHYLSSCPEITGVSYSGRSLTVKLNKPLRPASRRALGLAVRLRAPRSSTNL